MYYFFFILYFLSASCKPANTSKTSTEVKTTTPVTEVSNKQVTPRNEIDYDSTQWIELTEGDGYIIDIKYATADNFVKEAVYPCGRCFVKPKVAEMLSYVRDELRPAGYRIKLFDCYRPRPIQYKLWEKVPNPSYVADPKEGSMHNRGVALDLTLTDKTGKEIDMGTPYDFFGKEAHHDYAGLSEKILGFRKRLKSTMEEHGFSSIRTEWWHYSLASGSYPLEDWQWPCN
ncbi:MAG TPA: M15 family metallopeptidase [Saprospiraceae bacterium]|nr:M15 family metallopeptidase [Saprospiraceae bacterium]